MHNAPRTIATIALALAVASCSTSESASESGFYGLPPATSEADSNAPAKDRLAFTRAATDPFSTFASDVDTASYDLYRALVSEDALPPPERVRIEEFVNYFDYDYPAPAADAAHPFAISLAASPNGLLAPDGAREPATTILRVGVQAALPQALQRKPANIAFLIDVSGSMREHRQLVQRVLTETLTELEPDDRVSIVTYAGSTQVLLDSTPASEGVVAERIATLGSGGSTAGGAGLELAYEQVSRHFIDGGINHVILCTDGDFNVGPSSTEELLTLIRKKRATGITLTALGFGADANDAMLEVVSNFGNGVYGAITNVDQAVEYAHGRILSSLQLVAKDLKIQVEFNPELVYAYRLLGYENRALADDEFRDDMVDAGEVGAGHRVTAIYELARTAADVPKGAPLVNGEDSMVPPDIAGDDLVRVRVRYKQPDESDSDPATEVSNGLTAAAVTDAGTDLAWAYAVAAFAELLRERTADAEKLDTIHAVVSAQAQRDPARREFAALFDRARVLLEAASAP